MSVLPTLGETLSNSARKYPDEDAIVYPQKDIRWTYREFDDRVTAFANALTTLGVSKGDTISSVLHNSAAFAVAVYGTIRAGAVFNPINYRLAAGELTYIVDDCDSSVLLFEESTRAVVEEARDALSGSVFIDVDDDLRSPPPFAIGFNEMLSDAPPETPSVRVHPDDTYGVIYTSGTTGRPKGVVHSHEQMTYFNLLYSGQLGLTQEDHGILLMPMYHCSGLHAGLFTRINVGSKTVILHDFDADEAIRRMEEEKVTHTFVASRSWAEMLRAARAVDFDNSAFRLAVFGGETMPPSLLEECAEVFTDNFVTPYGMTEFGPAAVFPTPSDVRDRPGTVGRPAPNHDMRVVHPSEAEDQTNPVTPDDRVSVGDVGEIILRGPCMMDGYWNDEEQTMDAIRNGWYFTGDAGRLDEDGYLYLVDRVDDMIISGGENIYPAEIENVLYDHPSVEDVAVVGMDDETWGEMVTAAVIPDGSITATDLDTYCRSSDRLANFKRPKAYFFVENLPTNPSGKIQRYRIRDRLNEGQYDVSVL